MSTEQDRRTSPTARLTARLNSNFGEPRGNLGRLAGWIMARENVRANRLVVELLQIGPEDRVIEVGCGPGVALADAATRASRGLTVGVDPSDVMVAQAKRRCRAAIGDGRAEVRCAAAAELPFPDGSFTCAFSVNALPHWPSARDGLTEMRRVLAPRATMVVALRKQRDGGGVDPHAHGASGADIIALCAMLAELDVRDVVSTDHELGRETLVTIAGVVPQTD